MTFYAYVHARPDTTDASGVFYVGKGMGDRFNPLPVRNRYHGFVLGKHGAENILTGKLDCSSEAIAFDLERGLIKCLRRMGVNLTNMTDGGDGASGVIVSEETRRKKSENAKRMAQDPEIRARRSVATKAKNEKAWADPEYRERVSKAMRGKSKTLSAEALAARRANAAKPKSDEVKARLAEASKARWADPEFRARMAEKKKAAWADPEKRAAMLAGRSEGIRKSWLNTETRNKRIRGVKYSTNTSQKEK